LRRSRSNCPCTCRKKFARQLVNVVYVGV
jgi:hypothetical protein